MGSRVSLAAALWLIAIPALAANPSIAGRVTGSDGLPLPGATVSASSDHGKASSTVTDDTGRYTFSLPAGRYRVAAGLSGFQGVERNDVVLAGDDAIVLDFTLPLASFQQEVTVSAEAPLPLLGDPQPDAPATVTREVIDSAMLPNSQFDDVLALMPNVVRGPDGLISVAGARATQGALLVNGVNETDPISGDSGVMLPISAVDSVQVYSAGYPADIGRSTGGVTSVVTRAGTGRVQTSFDSFFPRLLFTDGGLRGVEFWDPNAGVSGPLVKDRLFFQQALSYRYDRNRFTTAVGPEDNQFTALLSWSQIDAQLSPAHRLTATLSFDPQSTDHARITAFTPATTVPRLDQGGWSTSIADRTVIGGTSTLELNASLIRTRSTATPDGSGPYQLQHDYLRGSYFDRQALRGERVEATASFTWTASAHHVARFGGSAGRGALDGSVQSAPVTLLRSDGTISRTVEFLAGGPVHASGVEIGAFAQDSWAVSRWLTLEGGIRYDHATAAADSTISPRLAWTVKHADSRTSVSGSAGLFADKVVLGALAFPSFPGRAVQLFDVASAPVDTPTVYSNVLGGVLNTPKATRWDVAVDRRVGDGWLTRLKYQERRGRDELVIDPAPLGASAGQLVLSSTGTSTARSFESTVGYRAPQARHELYLSYVRSSTRGDLNSVDAIAGPLAEPFVQPNQRSALPMDIPNRLLGWGLLHLRSQITIAPFVEIRDGFPFSVIDDDWNYLGARNSRRFPWFGSADLYVNKIVGLPGRLPDARVGLKVYNVASTHTEREVQRDLFRSDFGTTYDPVPRDFTIVFELLWGHNAH